MAVPLTCHFSRLRRSPLALCYVGHTFIHIIHIDHIELSDSNYETSSQPLPQPRIVVGLASGKCYIKQARTLPDGRASHCLLFACANKTLHCNMVPISASYDDIYVLACSSKYVFLVVVPCSCTARKLLQQALRWPTNTGQCKRLCLVICVVNWLEKNILILSNQVNSPSSRPRASFH